MHRYTAATAPALIWRGLLGVDVIGNIVARNGNGHMPAPDASSRIKDLAARLSSFASHSRKCPHRKRNSDKPICPVTIGPAEALRPAYWGISAIMRFDGAAHLGADGSNSGHPAPVEPGAFERHQCHRRHQYDWGIVLVGTGAGLPERRCHWVSATAAGLDAIPGKLLLIWDGACAHSIHRSRAV